MSGFGTTSVPSTDYAFLISMTFWLRNPLRMFGIQIYRDDSTMHTGWLNSYLLNSWHCMMEAG